MSKQMFALDEVQHIATSLASVANNAKQVELLLLGGGRGALAVLEVLQHYDWVKIHAVVDITEHAVAFPMARASGIHTSIDVGHTLEQFNGDIVIDVTGDKQMAHKIAPKLLLRKIELVSGKSAKLMFDLVNEQLRNEKTIHLQNTRLDLLDNMLAITTQLEDRPPLGEILSQSLIKLCNHLQAARGVSVIFNNEGAGNIISAIGMEEPDCAAEACIQIQQRCQELTADDRFKSLSPPVVLNCSNRPETFSTILLLWQQDKLTAALLMDIPGRLGRGQRTALNMTSIHLNMVANTLDQYEQLENMAMLDGLTGAYNRHFFDRKLKEEVNRIRRNSQATLACAFIDIDDFKQINDRFGHQIGDKVLKAIASAIASSIRDYDTCARYGGDEFVVLLPEESVDIHADLETIGLRMLSNIASIVLPDAPSLSISASIGMASQSAETLDDRRLLRMADHAVYQAKKAGKACLRIHSDEQFHLAGSS